MAGRAILCNSREILRYANAPLIIDICPRITRMGTNEKYGYIVKKQLNYLFFK